MGLRHTVFVEAEGQVHIVQGFMHLDAKRSDVRIIGMSELGMKLFDISVTPDGHVQSFVSPVMDNSQDALAAQIVLSVRRIFMSFDVSQDFVSYSDSESLLMISRFHGRKVVHECSLKGKVLRKTLDPGRAWDVEYTDYRDINGVYLPGRIAYHDQRAGYKLVMELHEVF